MSAKRNPWSSSYLCHQVFKKLPLCHRVLFVFLLVYVPLLSIHFYSSCTFDLQARSMPLWKKKWFWLQFSETFISSHWRSAKTSSSSGNLFYDHETVFKSALRPNKSRRRPSHRRIDHSEFSKYK
jgi:hypothetical protein